MQKLVHVTARLSCSAAWLSCSAAWLSCSAAWYVIVSFFIPVFNTAAAQDITITCGDRFGGNSFTDEDYFNNYGYPTKIKVWHGDYVDA